MSKERPKVLVLLAAYNGERWIDEQLRTILAQSDVDVYIVVSDDGSQDETLLKITHFSSTGRVVVVRPLSPTGSAAQNFFSLIRAQSADKFDFVSFADQDDLWYSSKLIRACRILTTQRAAGYSSAVVAQWPDGHERILTQVQRGNGTDFLFEGAGQGCTFLLSATFYQRLRSFIAAHAELTRALHYHDWTIYALARSWDLTWVFDQEPTMRYRQHDRNDTGARGSLAAVRWRLAHIKSGWYREQLQAVAELCHAAAPENATIAAWRALLKEANGSHRRSGIVRFCLSGSRRRIIDRGVIVLAACAGWL